MRSTAQRVSDPGPKPFRAHPTAAPPASVAKKLLRWLFVIATGWLLVGCGSSQKAARTPSETLRDYADAIEQGRTEDAYEMLADEAKRQISLESFKRMLDHNPRQANDLVASLRRETSLPVVTATVQTDTGEPLLLRYESGKWCIDVSAVDLYSQATPRHAVASFVRAFERQRFDILMRFVPENKKAGLDASTLKKSWQGGQKAEMERLVRAVKDALPEAHFEQMSGRATMGFGEQGAVYLVQEKGDWKIEDFAP